MKKLIAALSCALLAASSAALAQDKAKKEPSEKQKAQQERMKDCNQKMGDKNGRRAQEAHELLPEGRGARRLRQAEGAAAEDEGLQQAGRRQEGGDERKAFMSSCLKG